jgi:hypothetical protein
LDIVEFSQKNKWKYTTLGLMAILAAGFSFPQAFAHMTNNVNHVLAHIFDNTQSIEAKTDNLLLAGSEDIVRISETIHDGADNR